MSQMPDPTKTAELLVDHYQKTYEVTYELWNARNRLFPTMAAMIAGATVVAGLSDVNSLFSIGLGVFFKLDATQQAALQTALQNIKTDEFYQLVQTALMAIVFHMILDLYRHNQDISRNYEYIGGLEGQIRQALNFSDPLVAFTREGEFYRKHRVVLLGGVRWVYTLALGLLLGLYFITRFNHLAANTELPLVLFNIANVVIALAIALYYLDYAFPGVLARFKKR